MMEAIKNTYCSYVVQLALKCDSNDKMFKIIDSVIDGRRGLNIEGDEDITSIFNYMYQYRLYMRTLIPNKPQISNKVILKSFTKIIF